MRITLRKRCFAAGGWRSAGEVVEVDEREGRSIVAGGYGATVDTPQEPRTEPAYPEPNVETAEAPEPVERAVTRRRRTRS